MPQLLVILVAMRWDLHGVIIEGLSNNATLRRSWQASYAPLPSSTSAADLICRLDVVDELPTPPTTKPHFSQGELLHYYLLAEDLLVAHFPRFGQLTLNFAKSTTKGQILAAALDTYGVLEDLIAIGLSPHLRRRDLFLIHALAAACGDYGVLLVGGIGAGKTTTGMALLNAGWQLLSNDSPIVALRNGMPNILLYPGVLAAYPESFTRFSRTAPYAQEIPARDGWGKLTIAAETIWPDVWCKQALIGAILFPQIEDRSDHALERLSRPAALTRLMPHAMEQWDKALIPRHLAVLRRTVEMAPAYVLHLGSDVEAIPQLLAAELNLCGKPKAS